MSQININNLSFSYGGNEKVFDNVSFNFDTSWKCGLIGRNGSGKTTLLNLLQNKYEYEGNITLSENLMYFPFDIKYPNKTLRMIADEILLDHEEWKLSKELSLLKLDEDILDRVYKTLSYGEQVKFMLAILFTKDHEYLLIDEPTNHLDYEARDLVSDYLKNKDGFLLVSHDRKFLDTCIDHLIVLNRTSIEVRSGSFKAWYQDKLDKDEYEINKNIRLRKGVKRLDQSFRESQRASFGIESTKYGHGVKNSSGVDRGFVGHKAAKKMKLAKNIERRKLKDLEERKKLLKDVEEVDDLKMFNLDYHQESLIQYINCDLGYSEKPVLKNFNIDIKRNEVIKLKGKNGSGKSTIIKSLMRDIDIIAGEEYRGSRIKISYVPQSAKNLEGLLFDLAVERDVDQSQFMSTLAKMGVSREHFYNDVSSFSEGQKKKVLLALSLCEKAHLYIWDEPLNYIDIFTRMQIEDLIKEFKPTLVFVEHDEEFAKDIVNKLINL